MINPLGNRTLRIMASAALLAILALAVTLFVDRNADVSPVPNEDQTRTIGEASSAVAFNSLDDYIGYADHIVFGKVESISDFDEGTSEYVVKVQRQLKGDTRSQSINVYAVKQALEANGAYLLFLERFEGGLYPAPVYKVLDIEGLIKVDGDRLEHQNRYVAKELDMKALVEQIRSSKAIGKNREKKQEESAMVVMDSASARQLAESSDVVAHIEPESFAIENKYMKFARVNVVETFKGEPIGEESIVILPSSVEAGKRYLVHLQARNGLYIVTSKSGSVIEHSDGEAWREALAALEMREASE